MEFCSNGICVRFNILSTVMCWGREWRRRRNHDFLSFQNVYFFLPSTQIFALLSPPISEGLSSSIYLIMWNVSHCSGTPSSLSQLDIWNHLWCINWWLLHPLICHNYFISDWSECAIADGVRSEAPFPLLIKGSHFNWSLFNTNCSLCCKSVSVSLPRSLLANCLGSFLVSSWIEFCRIA